MRNASNKSRARRGRARVTSAGYNENPRPDESRIYNELLAEVNASTTPHNEERPLKRRKVGLDSRQANHVVPESQIVEPVEDSRQQTVFDDSETSEEDVDWEEVDLQDDQSDNGSDGAHDTPVVSDISVVLDPNKAEKRTARVTKRSAPAFTLARRIDIHKIHFCCLIFHTFLRNSWCNLDTVHSSLLPLLDSKTITLLNPNRKLTQLERSLSFMSGLERTSVIWRENFKITVQGTRRPSWATSVEDIKNAQPQDDQGRIESVKVFTKSSKTLKGSRDIGSQLYCALLRAAGLEARLVCSMQPLSFLIASTAPTPQKGKQTVYQSHIDELDQSEPRQESNSDVLNRIRSASAPITVRRLGTRPTHNINLGINQSTPRKNASPRVVDCPYPVYWIEVFNIALQKWFAVDPLVTETIGKPKKFEPPWSEVRNHMTYVIAFDEEGYAKDITKRYTKAYNAKTRKYRVESTKHGEKWWKKATKIFIRKFETDQDQIEKAELAQKEAAEPMPRNVQDFKNHPYYALERHLRHNEVIHPKREVGKLSIGKASSAVEPIYRKADVLHLRSADKWYRLGREIKTSEQPLKYANPRRTKRTITTPDADDTKDEDQGVGLYAEFQTEVYVPPPVIGGRVPRNVYGNLDVYVATMIPSGGVHIRAQEAAKAARIIDIDYADAVVGFEFRKRQGSAIIRGAVVARQYREAVEEVCLSLRYEQERAQQKKRTIEALKLWKRFLTALRIRQRIMESAVETDADTIHDKTDLAVEQEEQEEVEGGFYASETEQIMALPRDSYADVEEMHTQSASLEPTYNTYGLLPHETSIQSPWDNMVSVDDANKEEKPQPAQVSESHADIDEDEPGGFLRDTEDSASNPPRTSSKAQHDQSTSHTDPTTADVTTDEQGGGFIVDDGDLFGEQEIDDAKESASPLPVEDVEHTANQAKQEDDDELDDNDDEFDQGSMLSHDPEDDDAEPEWLADEATLL